MTAKADMHDELEPGVVVMPRRPEQAFLPPLVFERRVETTVERRDGSFFIANFTYVFRELDTWNFVLFHSQFQDDMRRLQQWEVMERSHAAIHSGNVTDDRSSQGGRASERSRKRKVMENKQASGSNAPATADQAAKEPKGKKTRTVDYTRTDKRPHSFRYKRGSTFVPRAGAISLAKEADGAFVIGQAPEGSTPDALNLESGTLELVSVKKRPNGKTAISFKHVDTGAEVVAYDARLARAALRAG